jgi:hypothetical protein
VWRRGRTFDIEHKHPRLSHSTHTSSAEQENESHRDAQSCAPGKFGRLSADLSEMSGKGEFLLPGQVVGPQPFPT